MSIVWDTLEKFAIQHGESIVKQECRRFLKRRTAAGVTPTKRKAIPKKWIEGAFLKQGGKCSICGNEMLLSEAVGDHRKALIQGGEHERHNIDAAHDTCNKQKGSNDFVKESKRRQLQ